MAGGELPPPDAEAELEIPELRIDAAHLQLELEARAASLADHVRRRSEVARPLPQEMAVLVPEGRVRHVGDLDRIARAAALGRRGEAEPRRLPGEIVRDHGDAVVERAADTGSPREAVRGQLLVPLAVADEDAERAAAAPPHLAADVEAAVLEVAVHDGNSLGVEQVVVQDDEILVGEGGIIDPA